MAGRNIEDAIKRELVTALRRWAVERAQFGTLSGTPAEHIVKEAAIIEAYITGVSEQPKRRRVWRRDPTADRRSSQPRKTKR